MLLSAEGYWPHVVIPEELHIFSHHPLNDSPAKGHIKEIY